MEASFRPRFKIRGNQIKSKQSNVESKVEFKNLTDDVAFLYWIDFQGNPILYAEINPSNRTDEGFQLVTFVNHFWVALLPGRTQALMNGKRYFFPPNPVSWLARENGGRNSKWTLNGNETSSDANNDDHFEVLLLKPGCRTLKDTALLCCCETFDGSKELDKLPRSLKVELRMCKQKYFWW
uniref:von Hippel-Lindau disease tumour suppressor beta domain-containing protein n=1 Tax=Clytia hemisphaerica TaxID=252671 RepID=A0A7M5V2A0_9CNID